MSTAIAKYGAVDLAALREEQDGMAKEREERALREGRMKLVVGKNLVRVLPPRIGQRTPFHVTFIHYLKNPAAPDKGGRPVVCPLKTRNEPCLICKRVSDLRRSGSEADKLAASEMGSSRRIYANVVNLNDPEKGCQVIEFGTRIYEDMLGILTDEEAGADFTHPDHGYNMVIERVGTKKEDTRYTVRMARTASPLADKKWLDTMFDLTATVGEMDNETIRAALEGRAPDEAAAPVGGTAEDDLYEAPRSAKAK